MDLERASRSRVELVERVGREPDEQRAGQSSRREQADERYRDELEHTRRGSPAQMRSEAAFGSAPQIVDHSHRTDRSDGRTVDDAHFPADERQTPAVKIDA